MEWVEVAVKTTYEAKEAVANILYDAGVNGIVIEDSIDFRFLDNEDSSWDYVDDSLLEKDFDDIIIKAYLPTTVDVLEKIELIRQLVASLPLYNINIGCGKINTINISEEEWSESWKKHFKPTKVGENIVIKPTWEDYTPKNSELIIELDPGMAFGTGTHETTIMCIKELEKTVLSGSIVLDIGCGSGILSIVSARLGASKVQAVDLDEVAVRVASKNVEMNKLENLIVVKHGNLMDVVEGKADIIVANIVADIVMKLSGKISGFLNPDGVFIASGIIQKRVSDVIKTFERNDLTIVKTEKMGEWITIVAKIEQKNS
ncbi:MAG: 50S ribosomal protein L11 methyltransferase [Clostridiales bacterium]|nr:50S ribosomal protein L11 methyltransferase [Clostridiales bacterium]